VQLINYILETRINTITNYTFNLSRPINDTSFFENFVISQINNQYSFYIVKFKKAITSDKVDNDYYFYSSTKVNENLINISNLDYLSKQTIDECIEIYYEPCSGSGDSDGHAPVAGYCNGSATVYDFSDCDFAPVGGGGGGNTDEGNTDGENTDNQNDSGEDTGSGHFGGGNTPIGSIGVIDNNFSLQNYNALTDLLGTNDSLVYSTTVNHSNATLYSSVSDFEDFLNSESLEMDLENINDQNNIEYNTKFRVRFGLTSLNINIKQKLKIPAINQEYEVIDVSTIYSGFTIGSSWEQTSFNVSVAGDIAIINLFGEINYNLFIEGVGTVFTDVKHYQMIVNIYTGQQISIIKID